MARACRVLVVADARTAEQAVNQAAALLGPAGGNVRLVVLLERPPILLCFAAEAGYLATELEAEAACELERDTKALAATLPEHIGVCCSLMNDRDRRGLSGSTANAAPTRPSSVSRAGACGDAC